MYYIEFPNITKNIMKEEYVRPINSARIQSWNIPISNFKEEIVNKFMDVGLEIKDGELFKKSTKISGVIHSDIIYDQQTESWIPNYCGLNINLDDTESIMYWFSTTDVPVYPPEDRVHKNKSLNGIHYGHRDKFHVRFMSDPKYTVLDKAKIMRPTLVRADIPHCVKNLDNKDRWCLSVRFLGNPSFEECAAKLALIN